MNTPEETHSIVELVAGIGQMFDAIVQSMAQIDAEIKKFSDQIAAVKAEETNALYVFDKQKNDTEKNLADARLASKQYLEDGEEESLKKEMRKIKLLLDKQKNHAAGKDAIFEIREAKLREIYGRLPDIDKLDHFPQHKVFLSQLVDKLYDVRRRIKQIV